MNKIESESRNHTSKRRVWTDSLVNCDNKTNHCNRYVSNGLFSGQNGSSKWSNDDESSHPINASNTNNKSERKRNINMLLNEEASDKDEVKSSGVGCDDDDGDYAKRMKVDCDGQDNNKSKMYQVREKRNFFLLQFRFLYASTLHLPSNNTTAFGHREGESLLIILCFVRVRRGESR